jgi:RNA polymerase sigma-70 factor (ECF subfamily)
MLAFQRGDESAFTALVGHYGARVVAFFRRGGADASAAEDLAQEAFLRVARARDRYEPTAKFTTWLHRILFRISLNDVARNRWRRSIGIGAGRPDSGAIGGDGASGPRGSRDVPELVADAEQLPVQQLTQAELREQVRTAVAALAEPQRTALLLHRFEDRSCEEIAEALGLTVPAVKSLLFRARDNVRRRLAPLLGDDAGGGENEVRHGL